MAFPGCKFMECLHLLATSINSCIALWLSLLGHLTSLYAEIPISYLPEELIDRYHNWSNNNSPEKLEKNSRILHEEIYQLHQFFQESNIPHLFFNRNICCCTRQTVRFNLPTLQRVKSFFNSICSSP